MMSIDLLERWILKCHPLNNEEVQLKRIIQRGINDCINGNVTIGTVNAKEKLAEMRTSQ